ncbi:MAG: CFI-box-CTERM domain-containing protein [Nostoc sp.]|uniref:CFI-box-CTERM domain-containing protein n=1 Tax=Nostoc sp. TaxID=1180 RepID=UPI002FF6AE45
MPHLAGSCDCGRKIHFPKNATIGTQWKCYTCGKVWTLSEHGEKPLHSKGSKAPPTSPQTVTSNNCFVVTATFGTPYAEEVIKYRHFRDKWLNRSFFGRTFIHMYYYVGPVLAEYIKRNPFWRRVMAVILGNLAKFLPKVD